jgi:hypothetical protein
VIKEFADAPPGGVDGSLRGFAEQRLELGEDLLDRVEVGTVGGQEEELWRRFCGRLGARLALV